MCVYVHDCKDHRFCSDPRCILCISSFCHIFPHSGDQISSRVSSACVPGKLLLKQRGVLQANITSPKWVGLTSFPFQLPCLAAEHCQLLPRTQPQPETSEISRVTKNLCHFESFLKGMLLWREEVDGRVTERPFGGQMRFIGLSLSMTTNDLSSSGGFTN